MPSNRGWRAVERLPPLSSLVNDRVSVLSVGSDCWALWAEEGSVEDLYAAIVEVLPAQPYSITSGGSSQRCYGRPTQNAVIPTLSCGENALLTIAKGPLS